MPSSVRIVPVRRPEQLAAAAALFREYAASLSFELCFQDFERELDGLPGAYAPPHGEILLAEQHAAPLGCVAVRPLASAGADACEMKRMYVRPAARGRGVGRQLAGQIVSVARAAGYGRMLLDTIADMRAAIALYESLGFRPVAAYCHNPIPNARYFEMRLRPEI